MRPLIIAQEVRKIHAFGFFWMFLPIIPMLVPFQLSLGLNMQQIFWVQVCFGVVCAAFEVPSGYLCDLWGRKNTLLVGALLWALGFAYLTQVHDFVGMLIYEAILGVAVSLVSGADIAMLYDWLAQDNSPRETTTQALARHQMAQVLAEAVAGALAGALVLLSYQHVVAAQALAGVFPLGMALFLREPPYSKLARHSHWQNLRSIWHHVFGQDRLLRLIFLNQVLWSLATFVMVWLQPKLWTEEGVPLAVFGLLWALSNLVVGLTGQQAARLEKRWGSAHLLVCLALLPIVGYVLVALSHGWRLVVFALVFPVSRGLTQIILKDAINWRTPGAMRATVLSLNSLFFRLGFALLGPLTGWMSDVWGTRSALWLLAGFFALGFVALLLPLLHEIKRVAPRAENPS
ncbi:MAG: MFS transporter [Candidatus Sericytochromatia bacterium]